MVKCHPWKRRWRNSSSTYRRRRSVEVICVQLDWQEQIMAIMCGHLRTASGMAARGGQGLRSGADPHYTDIQAAGAELAASKALRLPWLMSVSNGPDLHPHYEVKHTVRGNGNLLVKRGLLHQDWRYILVRGLMPKYEVVGWC